MWTRFMDMHSGGGQKEKWAYIYIEAPEQEAIKIFYSRFGHNPNRVSCTCCGDDYFIDEHETLEQATAYERNCEYAHFRPDGTECPEKEAWKSGVGTTPGYSSTYVERQREQNIEIRQRCNTPTSDPWGLYLTLDQYLKKPDVLVIYEKDIKDRERHGEVPEQGYVWIDNP